VEANRRIRVVCREKDLLEGLSVLPDIPGICGLLPDEKAATTTSLPFRFAGTDPVRHATEFRRGSFDQPSEAGHTTCERDGFMRARAGCDPRNGERLKGFLDDEEFVRAKRVSYSETALGRA
jgi:hypothetical protein